MATLILATGLVTGMEEKKYDKLLLKKILNEEIEVIVLPSDDLLIVCMEGEGKIRNDYASLLSKRDIRGDAVLLAVKEIEC